MLTTLLAETLRMTFEDQGSGRPYLLLHGGAGPRSMQALAYAVAARARTILPTLPGFEGTPRPAWLHTVGDLASACLALVERLDLRDVVLVCNSVSGWIAAEMALRTSPRVASLVLVNAVGLDPGPTGGIVDPAGLPPAERAAHSFHDPAHASALGGPDAAARMAANQQVLRAYAGEPFMHDPTLRGRLPALALPTLVLWGGKRPHRHACLWPAVRRPHPRRPVRDRRGGRPLPPGRADRGRCGAARGAGLTARPPVTSGLLQPRAGLVVAGRATRRC